MNDDFRQLDAWLRESAAHPSVSTPPDFRQAVLAEIARRKAAAPWRRLLAWLEFSEPFFAPSPQIAALALASTLAIGVTLPLQLSRDNDQPQRAVRALHLDSFAAPGNLWPLAR